MRIRTPWPVARSRQRNREFAAVFAGVAPRSLGAMLEVGSGDGYMASLLAPLGCSLVTTEPTRGCASHAVQLPRLRCSVTALPLPDAAFDFIFSSSVLEHVRDRDAAMAELRRCLKPGGVMVHLMPSPTWKLLQLAFYYPHLVLSGLEAIGPSPKPAQPAQTTSTTASTPTTSTELWHDPATKLTVWQEIKRGVFPQVHGEFDGHVRELFGFRARAWVDTFERAGFAVHARLDLPLYSGYGFGLERLRRVGEAMKLSAHNAFIVGLPAAPPACWPWPCQRRA
jgi:SAM-dependent methyltransferase